MSAQRMQDVHITTEAQLDAALAAQRANRIERLRGQSRLRFFWVGVLSAASIVCFVLAYLSDRHWAQLSGIGIVLLSTLLTYFKMRKQRERAAVELAREQARQ